ncbi:DUF3987 domain-containing protein [Acidobacteria bacterium ACD]|nr:DUF3987 domain-containing protein [Acidobacteria bacterium ACD]
MSAAPNLREFGLDAAEADRFLCVLFPDSFDYPPAARVGPFALPSKSAAWTAPTDRSATIRAAAGWSASENVYVHAALHDLAAVNGRGSSDSASVATALWADLDVLLPGHRHRSAALPQDLAALEELLAALAIPPSVRVHSGFGLQAYWLLREPVALSNPTERAHYLDAAARLEHHVATLADERGWTFDRVADLARILRLPGTVNTKNPDALRPVRLLDARDTEPARYNLADFLELPEAPPETTAPAPERVPLADDERAALASRLVAWALRRAATTRGRNPSGFDLACQLRDAGFTRVGATMYLREYADRVRALWPERNFADEEALGALRQAFKREPRSSLPALRPTALSSPPRCAVALAAPAEAAPPEEPWPARQPLPPLTAPVPTLPADLLPDVLAPWLTDVAERVSIPLEFVAAPALVGLGAVVGRGIAVRPFAYDDFSIPGNLWGGIVGPPGTMKTSAVEQALRPLRRLVVEARKAFESSAADRDANAAALEAKMKAAKSRMEAAAKKRDAAGIASGRSEFLELSAEAKAARVTERRYTTSDATIEKLGALLNENPRGMLVVRDELTGWFRGLDRDDRAQDRAFYLEAWNGTGSFTVDRIIRGTLHVEALCLSIVGGIQPGRLSTYVRGAVAGEEDADGLLQRFQLIVWPDDFGEWRAVDRWPAKEARDRAFHVYERLALMDPVHFGATVEEGELPYLRLDPAAQALFIEWRHELERRIRSEEMRAAPAFEAHLAKYRSLLPKLALLFHLAEVADGGARPGPVTLRSTQRAAAWTDFLEAHARKVYAAELAGDMGPAHALAEKIEEGAVRDGTSVRAIAQRDWSGLRSHGSVYAAAEVLSRYGWLRIEDTQPGDRGGRPSTLRRLHPDLRRTAR